MAAKKTKKHKPREWTRNRTGKQPVGDGVWVEVRLRSGDIEQSPAEAFRWSINRRDDTFGGDIMAWRRIRKPRSDKGTKVGKVEIDLANGKTLHMPHASVEPEHKGRDELAAQVEPKPLPVIPVKFDAPRRPRFQYVDIAIAMLVVAAVVICYTYWPW